MVDDDEVVKDAVRSGLNLYGYNVCTASNGVEALAQLEYQLPALILLDIAMPGMDGVELCSIIREDTRWNSLPIIFLTGNTELKQKITAYTVGGDDYLCKPFDIHELNLRIKAVLRRSTIPNQQQDESEIEDTSYRLNVGGLRLDIHSAAVETEKGIAYLTPTELILLRYLMQHPNQLFSSEHLLEKVWEYPPRTGDPALVRWHMKNLRLKIEAEPDQPRFLQTVPHHGYILRI
ncbi:MAG: response regulator transcription factor [Caldilineaceae bacterium]